MIERIFSKMALDVVETSMELHRERHKYISANIANADTPNYKAVRFSFEDELQRAVYGGDELPLYTTDPKHIQVIPERLSDVRGSVSRVWQPLRNDENTVDIDKEMARLAENQIMYETLVQAYSQQLAKLKYAITGR